MGFLAFGALAAVAQLLIFHTYLVRNDSTTYDYIMGRIARARAAESGGEAAGAGAAAARAMSSAVVCVPPIATFRTD